MPHGLNWSGHRAENYRRIASDLPLTPQIIMATIQRLDISAVILAGGRSRRMAGTEKALLEVEGTSLLGRTIAALRPQVTSLVISTGSRLVQSAAGDLPTVADPLPGFLGPLAGILSGLDWTRDHAPQCRWLISVPVDAPMFPADLVSRLVTALETEGADLACAASGGRRHPVFGLWPLALADELRRAVTEEGVRKVDHWTSRHRLAVAAWPGQHLDPFHPDPFHNVNTPEDLDLLRMALIRAGRAGEESSRSVNPL